MISLQVVTQDNIIVFIVTIGTRPATTACVTCDIDLALGWPSAGPLERVSVQIATHQRAMVEKIAKPSVAKATEDV